MPEEIVQPSNIRKNLKILIVTIFLLMLANFTVYFSGALKNLDSGVFLIQHKWNLLYNLDSPVEWLILGDSSANQGVNTEVLRSANGGQALNLGTVGNTLLIEDVWMLQSYIEAHGAPNNVVIVHVYDMWARQADTSVFAHVPWSRMSGTDMFSSVREQAELLWYKYIPLYQSDTQIFRAISNPLNMFTPPIYVNDDGFTRVDDPNPSLVSKDINNHSTKILTKQFQVSPTNSIAIEMLVNLANKHDLDVFIANSPIHEDLAHKESFSEYFKHVSDLLKEIDHASINIHYVLQETPKFDSTMMENVDHVTIKGSEIFTSKLISEIDNYRSNQQ